MIKIYNLIMDSAKNPLSNIPDINTRHMIMQVLAWMWCIIFSMYLGSIVASGYSDKNASRRSFTSVYSLPLNFIFKLPFVSYYYYYVDIAGVMMA